MTSAMYDSDEACNRSPPPVEFKPKYGVEKASPPPFVKVAAAGDSPPLQPHIAQIAQRESLDDRKKPSQPPDFDTRDLKRPNPGAANPRKEETGPLSKEFPQSEGDAQYKPPLSSFQQPTPVIKRELSPPRNRLDPSIDQSRRPSQDFIKPSPEAKTRVPYPPLQPIKSDGLCLAKSPDSSTKTQTLPSIHKALSALSSDFAPTVNTMSTPFSFSPCPGSTPSGTDSPFDRPFPGKFVPASPYSHISPVSMKDTSTNPSPASHASFWRATPSEMVSAQTPYEASPMTATSPATSYPTPTEQVGMGMGDRVSLAPPNGGPVGSYKCTHPGCTAAPFQTQYLLNSHANVHSQDRPHFCPEEGCPRSLGGKGFKRKNEMMRHGLVHNSPGYVCPFCPDQQHKYPRPDNLQRHVRVHHVDKNKDDPILRQVLAQRPLGSLRGRKRIRNNT